MEAASLLQKEKTPTSVNVMDRKLMTYSSLFPFALAGESIQFLLV